MLNRKKADIERILDLPPHTVDSIVPNCTPGFRAAVNAQGEFPPELEMQSMCERAYETGLGKIWEKAVETESYLQRLQSKSEHAVTAAVTFVTGAGVLLAAGHPASPWLVGAALAASVVDGSLTFLRKEAESAFPPLKDQINAMANEHYLPTRYLPGVYEDNDGELRHFPKDGGPVRSVPYGRMEP